MTSASANLRCTHIGTSMRRCPAANEAVTHRYLVYRAEVPYWGKAGSMGRPGLAAFIGDVRSVSPGKCGCRRPQPGHS
jgi:hypothetical protein